jgi:hypothetical protein
VLFVLYLSTPSATPDFTAVNHWVITNSETCGRKRISSNLKYYLTVFLKHLSKTTKNIRHSNRAYLPSATSSVLLHNFQGTRVTERRVRYEMVNQRKSCEFKVRIYILTCGLEMSCACARSNSFMSYKYVFKRGLRTYIHN